MEATVTVLIDTHPLQFSIELYFSAAALFDSASKYFTSFLYCFHAPNSVVVRLNDYLNQLLSTWSVKVSAALNGNLFSYNAKVSFMQKSYEFTVDINKLSSTLFRQMLPIVRPVLALFIQGADPHWIETSLGCNLIKP